MSQLLFLQFERVNLDSWNVVLVVDEQVPHDLCSLPAVLNDFRANERVRHKTDGSDDESSG